MAVGGVLKAIDSVMEKEVDNAFCAVRPPGHHAELDKAMGVLLFQQRGHRSALPAAQVGSETSRHH